MPILTKAEISTFLDIGPEFLFVDSCEHTYLGVESRTSYTFNERHKYLKHHFLSEVVIPGALIMESMLQSMALTIYSGKSWKGKALISSLSAQFFEPMHLNAKIENSTQITVNSGGRIEGEITCISNEKIVSKMTCSYYSDYIFRSLNNVGTIKKL
jgi:3-hydroxymyristoyl/3-hydroxydecanoyl-(acyl carrier protein) dehydratase